MPVEENLLVNPSFGEPYIKHQNEVKVAYGWGAYWSDGEEPPLEPSQGPTAKPEMRAATQPERIMDGDAAQLVFVRWKVMQAGLYQSVQVPIGAIVTWQVYLHCWCSDSDDPTADDGELYARIGVDVDGGEAPWSEQVIGTEWMRLTNQYQMLSMEFVAVNPVATVYVEVWNKWKLSHNDAYIDAASCTVQVEPGPGPDPESGQELRLYNALEGESSIPLRGNVYVERDGAVVRVQDSRWVYWVPVAGLVVVKARSRE